MWVGRVEKCSVKLLGRTKLIISPTAAGNTYEMMEGTAVDLIKIIIRGFTGTREI